MEWDWMEWDEMDSEGGAPLVLFDILGLLGNET